MFHFKLSSTEISINLSNVIVAMGYGKENIPNGLEEVLYYLYTKFNKVILPECGFIIPEPNSAKQFGSGIILNETTFNTGSKIASCMKNIEGCVLFVITIGEQIDSWIHSLVDEDDVYSAYLVDSIASEYVEKLSDWIENKIKVQLGSGIGVSNRYGPGYCDWALEEQVKLFSFFPNNFCGISLSESSMMQPRKSISGIVGFGKSVFPMELPCDVCTDYNCHRNKNEKKNNYKKFSYSE